MHFSFSLRLNHPFKLVSCPVIPAYLVVFAFPSKKLSLVLAPARW